VAPVAITTGDRAAARLIRRVSQPDVGPSGSLAAVRQSIGPAASSVQEAATPWPPR